MTYPLGHHGHAVPTLTPFFAYVILPFVDRRRGAIPVQLSISYRWEMPVMERIKTLNTRNLCESAKNGGCGECQTSCQSACKTSCGVANQQCEKADK